MADTPRHGDNAWTAGGTGWVESPDLPDPKLWSTGAQQAAVPGWRDGGGPPEDVHRPPTGATASPRPAARTSRSDEAHRRKQRQWRWKRAAPWLLGVVLLGGAQLPALLLASTSVDGSHLGPPDDAVLARYDAADGVVGDATYTAGADPRAADRAGHDALWAEWTELVPPYWARRVEVFEVASDGTGPGTFAAYVQALDPQGDRWLLAVDPNDAAEQPEHYHDTLVHELAHILTLGDGARTTDRGPFRSLADAQATCGGAVVRHGCLTEGSLVARFVKQFWTPEDLAAADRIHAAGPAGLQDAAIARYRQRSTAFVSPYAVTDPAEDIAETVVALAFGERQPPRSIAEAKVDFLRTDPELVALVDRVRATLLTR